LNILKAELCNIRNLKNWRNCIFNHFAVIGNVVNKARSVWRDL